VTYAGAGGLLFGAGTGFGGIFKLTPGGGYSVLYIFTNGLDGSYPTAGLTPASDGSLYGVTASGGLYDNGTVFKLAEDGTFTNLYSFSGFSDGGRPSGELTAYDAATLFGTTFGGGAGGLGTVFEIATNGQLTPIYSFTGKSDGAGPEAGLTLGCDGNLYGVASSGGASDMGTVFEITTNGGLTNLHSFSGSDGTGPIARLTPGSDGNFYGTTFGGGTYGDGVIFKIDTNGNFVVLQMLNAASGAGSLGQLFQASDGAFYGTTSLLGISPDGNYPRPAEWDGDGTIFRITGTGAFSVVYSFGQISDEGSPLDGANPYAGLIAGAGGALYGTTYEGGAAGNGTIFQIELPPIVAPVFQSVRRAGETTTLAWSASWGVRYQLQYTEDVNSTEWTNLGPVRATTNSVITVDDSTSDPQRFYRLYIP
jgi:uncharacterized repeat protein (TIGR03803 family)